MKLMFAVLSVMLAASLASAEQKPANPLVEGPTWNELKEDIVGKTTILDGAALFAVTAPYRANDAATVPVTIEQTDASAGPIDSIKLVIDENPAPLAAEIRFGRAMAPLRFETRIRVNQYSNVRAIAETSQGTFMSGRFVKASGGCSAPATKDPVAALNGIGEMRLKLFDDKAPASDARREAQIMIRHPNYSGLQRDQTTQLFISANFITQLEVKQGDELLFALDGGISVSENPVFRFSYTDNGAPAFTVHAIDTDGNVFDRVLPKKPPA